jgi:hypothetical protein
MSHLRQWSVHKFFSSQTTPPKPKRVIVAYVYPTSFLGLYINTSIPHIHNTDRLKVCYAELLHSEHPTILEYNSWVGCDVAHEFDLTEIGPHTLMGDLSSNGRKAVEVSLLACPILRPKTLSLILSP